MSALISEGGIGRRFEPVNKLKINNQDEGQSLWVAEDTLNTGSINVTSNGVYSAVEDELFAYDEVTVDVAEDITDPSDTGSVTGKDADGNDYEYSLGEDGNLDVNMIPAAIHIVVKPRKLKYEDGEILDFTGIHVYLMDGNNKRYTDTQYPTGEIPFNELIFPVTVADISQVKDTSYTSDILPSDMESFSPTLTAIFRDLTTDITTVTYSVINGQGTLYDSGWGSITNLRASKEPDTVCIIRNSYNSITGEFISTEELTTNVDSYTYTHNGKTVYYADGSTGHSNVRIDEELPHYNWGLQTEGAIAWTLIYGDIIIGGQEIPVQWMRSDGEILEDTFEIEVGEGGEPGPPEPDPWAGDYDVSWNGHTYNINRRIVPEVHYANGYCWQEGTTEYTVEQAVGFGWLIRVGM